MSPDHSPQNPAGVERQASEKKAVRLDTAAPAEKSVREALSARLPDATSWVVLRSFRQAPTSLYACAPRSPALTCLLPLQARGADLSDQGVAGT